MKPIPLKSLAAMVAAALPILGGGPAAAGDSLQEKSELALDPSGWTALEVGNARGAIEVRGSPDGRFHLVAVKTVRGAGRRHAAEVARQVDVTTDQYQGRFVVTVHYPQRTEIRVGFWDVLASGEFPRVEVRLQIAAPERLPIRLRSGSGDLLTEGRAGAQDLETSSGNIQVHGAAGRIEAASTSGDLSLTEIAAAQLHTTSGDVSVSGARGPLSARSTSGDVAILAAADSLSLETVSGDIRVDAAPRGLEIETVSGQVEAREVAGVARLHGSSGDIVLDLAAPLRRVRVDSVSGDVRLHLPAGLGCDLDVRSSSGAIEAGLPMTLRTVSRHAIVGGVAGGGVPIVVRTASGDIAVAGGDS